MNGLARLERRERAPDLGDTQALLARALDADLELLELGRALEDHRARPFGRRQRGEDEEGRRAEERRRGHERTGDERRKGRELVGRRREEREELGEAGEDRRRGGVGLERLLERGEHDRLDLGLAAGVHREQVGDNGERLAERVAACRARHRRRGRQALEKLDECGPERRALAREALQADEGQVEQHELVLPKDGNVDGAEELCKLARERLEDRSRERGEQAGAL